MRIGRYIIREFSPLWWVVIVGASFVVLGLFIGLLNVIGGC